MTKELTPHKKPVKRLTQREKDRRNATRKANKERKVEDLALDDFLDMPLSDAEYSALDAVIEAFIPAAEVQAIKDLYNARKSSCTEVSTGGGYTDISFDLAHSISQIEKRRLHGSLITSLRYLRFAFEKVRSDIVKEQLQEKDNEY